MAVPYPIEYEQVELPKDFKPSEGIAVWHTPKGLQTIDPSGKVIFLDTSEKTYAAGSQSDAPISHRAIATVVDKLGQVESARAPTIADLDKPWTEWWHYAYDFPNAKATVSVWKRSPVSNDLFPPLNPLGQIDIALPAPVDLPNGNKQVEMPQGATFEYQVTRNAASNSVTFPAGTFSAINSYYLDAAKTVLNVGVRAQTVTPTQTSMGLGIVVAAPANAAFVRYEFQYVAGGSLIYDFAI